MDDILPPSRALAQHTTMMEMPTEAAPDSTTRFGTSDTEPPEVTAATPATQLNLPTDGLGSVGNPPSWVDAYLGQRVPSVRVRFAEMPTFSRWPTSRRSWIGIALLATLLPAFAIFLTLSLLVPSSHTSTVPLISSPVAIADERFDDCALVREPFRMMVDVDASVPVVSSSSSRGIVVASALRNGEVLQQSVTWGSRRPTEQFREKGTGKVSALSFGIDPWKEHPLIDRDVRLAHPQLLEEMITLPNHPHRRIGFNKSGLALALGGRSRPVNVWELGEHFEPQKLTMRQFIHDEYQVILKDKMSRLHVGWFNSATAHGSQIQSLPIAGVDIGTPSLLHHQDRWLLAVAGKPSETQPYRIVLTQARAQQIPMSSHSFNPWQQGAVHDDSDQMAPRLEALGDSRVLLQWTEGTVGNRTTYVVILSDTLEPTTKPLQVSPEYSTSGGGTLSGFADRNLSTFLVQRSSGYELWGQWLDCRSDRRNEF